MNLAMQLITLLFLGFIYGSHVNAATPEIPRDAIKAWNKYEAMVASTPISGTIKLDRSIRYQGQTKPMRCCTYTILAGDGAHSLSIDDGDEQQEVLFVVNPRYSFELNRNKQNPDWFLKQLNLDPSKPHSQYSQQAQDEFRSLQLAPVTLSGQRLLDLIAQPGFEVTVSESISVGDEQLYLVEFRNSQAKSLNQFGSFAIKQGQMTLDPARGYIVRQCTIQDSSLRYESTFEYESSTGPFPLLKRYEMVSTPLIKMDDGGPPPIVTRSATCQLHTQSVDISQFTLTNYGMPEPEGFEVARSSYLHWWFAGIAFLFAGLAVTFWRRATRIQN